MYERSRTSCATGGFGAIGRRLAIQGDPDGQTARDGAGGTPQPAELRLLPTATHLTFKQIGERLFVSRNTVSSEVGSIYRKLGVSSRSDAVQHATAIGLLGG